MSEIENSKINRRDALKKTGTLLPVAMAVPALLSASGIQAAPSLLPKRTLGRTGERLSVFTLGTGHFRARIMDVDRVKAIVDWALELGVNSIDTAPNYDESHEFLGKALEGRRDSFFLATKTEEPTYDGCMAQLEKSLKDLKTGHIDLLYLHNLASKQYFPSVEEALGPKGALKALLDAKKKGLVRYIGASAHSHPARFNQFVKSDDIDVYLCAINLAARYIYDFESKVVEPGRKKNCGSIAMKVLGGAANFSTGTPQFEKKDHEMAIRYALQVPGVCSANIGVRSVKELDIAVQTAANAKPFTPEEAKQVEKQGKKLANKLGAFLGTPVT